MAILTLAPLRRLPAGNGPAENPREGVSDVGQSAEEWVSVTAAAGVCQVSERTIFRWIAKGRVDSRVSEGGQREVRRTSLPVSANPSVTTDTPSDAGHAPSESVVSQGVGPDSRVTDTLREELRQAWERIAEQKAEIAALEEARRERDFLRERLVESEKGEAELRVLLLNSQQALAAAEERLALPVEVPAPPTPDLEPEKRPWWQPAESAATTDKRPLWKKLLRLK